jgi:tetratricopeptide (TPR) repeat protein
VFGHEFVRQAVERRYLPGRAEQQEAHGALAEWFEGREGWDERVSEEFLWQLQQAGRIEELRIQLLTPRTLLHVVQDRGSREVLKYWQMTIRNDEEELDKILSAPVQQELDRLRGQPDQTIFFADKISELLEDAGLYRDLHLKLRHLSYQKDRPLEEAWPGSKRFHKLNYALALHLNGQQDKAIELLRDCILDELNEEYRDFRLYLRMCDLASMLAEAGNDESMSEAIDYYEKALPELELAFGEENPDYISLRQDYAILLSDAGRLQEARCILSQCLVGNQYLYGNESIESALTKWNLAVFFFNHGESSELNISLSLARQSIASFETLLMGDHTTTLLKKIDFGLMLVKTGQRKQGLKIARESLKKIVTILGRQHPIAIHAYGIMTEIEFRSGHPVRSLFLLPKAFGI